MVDRGTLFSSSSLSSFHCTVHSFVPLSLLGTENASKTFSFPPSTHVPTNIRTHPPTSCTMFAGLFSFLPALLPPFQPLSKNPYVECIAMVVHRRIGCFHFTRPRIVKGRLKSDNCYFRSIFGKQKKPPKVTILEEKEVPYCVGGENELHESSV